MDARTWVSTKTLAAQYEYHRKTIWEHTLQMSMLPKFADGIRGHGKSKRIDVNLYDEFLKWKG
ncbi:MAG: hypothetical protein E6672_06260 [Negativicoccus succinicivorans]|nr:hypothetical protein [Negativicoccus succinicivorans]